MEDAGFLERLIRPIVIESAKSTGRLIASVIGTCIGLNIIAGDQYVAIVMPSRVYRLEFAKRGIAPRMLSRPSRTRARSRRRSCRGTAAAPTWPASSASRPSPTCRTAFFNLLSPLISLIYGFTGFRIEHVEPPTGESGHGSETGRRLSQSEGARNDRRRSPNRPSEKRGGFALPSAYTILFVLIVLMAIAT